MHYSVTFNHRWQCGIHGLRESFSRWVSTDALNGAKPIRKLTYRYVGWNQAWWEVNLQEWSGMPANSWSCQQGVNAATATCWIFSVLIMSPEVLVGTMSLNLSLTICANNENSLIECHPAHHRFHEWGQSSNLASLSQFADVPVGRQQFRWASQRAGFPAEVELRGPFLQPVRPRAPGARAVGIHGEAVHGWKQPGNPHAAEFQTAPRQTYRLKVQQWAHVITNALFFCFFFKIGFQQLCQETIITWGPESCLDKAMYPVTQCYHHTNDRNKNRAKKPKHEQTARQHEIRKSFACRGSTRCVPTVCKSSELEWLALFLQLILHSFCLCLDKVSKHIF